MEKTIGMRIKECRVKMGMTQEELAEVLFIPKSTVSAYERDVVDMKMGIITEITHVLHTTSGYLIDGEEMQFDQDVMELAMMFQEIKNKEIRRVALEQAKALTKLVKYVE